MTMKASVDLGRILSGMTVAVAVFATFVTMPVHFEVLEFHLAESLKL